MKRLLLGLTLLTAFLIAWKVLDTHAVRVVGQPSMTGPIQSQLERPFFESLGSIPGLSFRVDYRTVDSLGFKDSHQLGMLKQGLYDMVSLRFLQNAHEEPSILGIDLVGLNKDFDDAKKSATAYAAVINNNLEKHYDAKLLGIWTFGPQVIMCKQKVAQLADLKGLRVRVGSNVMLDALKSLGAIPIVVPFDQVKDAFSQNMIDCAVSSLTSGQAAGWGEFIHHIYPISLQMGLNGIAIRASLWNRLSDAQQATLKQSVSLYIDQVWDYAKKLDQDAKACFEAKQACPGYSTHKAEIHPVLEEDQKYLRQFALSQSLHAWAKDCDQQRPNCSQEWKQHMMEMLR